MKRYTVVGYYESTSQVFTAHVISKDETAAVTDAVNLLDADPDDLMVVSILKGHHVDQNDCQTISCAKDWPAPQGD